MDLIDGMPNVDFNFGFSCNGKLLAVAASTRLYAVDRWMVVPSQRHVRSAGK